MTETEIDDFQQALRERKYRTGYYMLGKPKQKYYFDLTFDSWHDAQKFSVDFKKSYSDPNVVVFVEPK